MILRSSCLICLMGLALLLPACASVPVSTTSAASEALTCKDHLDEDVALARSDWANFYTPLSLSALAGGIAAAAPLANGSADEDVRHWYQSRIHHKAVNPAATTASIAGQVWVAVPLGLEVVRVLGHGPEESLYDGGWFEWSNRSLRAAAVGYPPVLALFGLLGAGRPSEFDSRWQPFHDFHGASGHTFIAAVPFLTATAMTENRILKAPLVAGSFLGAWSRIHDDKHYLSQVCLGWGIAALAVWSVDRTQESDAWSIKPVAGPDGAGLALELSY